MSLRFALHRLASLRSNTRRCALSIRFSDPLATTSVALQIVMAKLLVSTFRRRFSVWHHGDGPEAMFWYRFFALGT